MASAAEAEVEDDFVDKAGAFIELEVEVEVGLGDHALVDLDEAAGDVLRDEGHAKVASDARFLDLLFETLVHQFVFCNNFGCS